MNPSSGQSSLDYLNQIAPQAPKKKVFELNIKNVLIISTILVVFVTILSLIVPALSGGKAESWQRLSLRIGTTASITDSARPYIKDSSLRSLNSDLKLSLTSAQRDIAPLLPSYGIDPNKMSDKIIAQEDGKLLVSALDEGRLNAMYDSTYAREMTYQVSTLLTLLQQLHSSTSGEKSKEYLETTYNNILPTYELLEKYSSTNE